MDHLTEFAEFTTDDARALLPHWQLALRAEPKSPGTIDTHTYVLRSASPTYSCSSNVTASSRPPLPRVLDQGMRLAFSTSSRCGATCRICRRHFIGWLGGV